MMNYFKAGYNIELIKIIENFKLFTVVWTFKLRSDLQYSFYPLWMAQAAIGKTNLFYLQNTSKLIHTKFFIKQIFD